MQAGSLIFLLTPLREGRPGDQALCHWHLFYFYSRPCGRGDVFSFSRRKACSDHFYSRPCGRGDVLRSMAQLRAADFYSRPCGRGDMDDAQKLLDEGKFLLTPLREGRPLGQSLAAVISISTHAPAGGATPSVPTRGPEERDFYSRPCGRGDQTRCIPADLGFLHFYSRPCGRGDQSRLPSPCWRRYFYSRPCGRGDNRART